MTSYLLDTNAISDVMRSDPTFRERLAQCNGDLLTSVVVMGEIYYGIERITPGPRRKQLEIKARRAFAALRVQPLNRRAAEIYAATRRSAETNSGSLEDNDLWIAAAALAAGATLVSRDTDFRRILGLAVEDWSQ